MQTKTTPIILMVLITTVSLLLFTPSVSHASDTHSKYKGVMVDDWYDRLARCETGGNWKHSTRSYTGGLGIYRGTWQRWSNSSSAKGKTAMQQVQVADAIAFKGHTEPSGEYVYPVGVFGWGCVKNNAVLKAMICKSNKPLVKRWHNRCNKYK
jgi:hypothetical protein